MAYGTDLNLVNEIQNLGIPTLAQGPFAPGNTGYLEDAGRPQFDEARAKELVAQYREEEGKDLAFTLTHAGDPETTAQFGRALMDHISREIEQDVPIWENKEYVAQPVLTKGDGPIAAWRNWCRQFYPDPG